MSPRRFVDPRWWVAHWSNALLYLVVTAVFVFTVNQASNQRESDRIAAHDQAVTLRDSDVRVCDANNERTAVLRDFLLSLLRDPRPDEFAYIDDPQLRAGVIEQGRRSRAEARTRVEATFTVRDCPALYPPVPPLADR